MERPRVVVVERGAGKLADRRRQGHAQPGGPVPDSARSSREVIPPVNRGATGRRATITVRRGLTTLAICALLAGCGGDVRTARPPAPGSAPAAAPPPWFADVSQTSGIDFVHFNGMSGRFYQP